MGQNKQAGPAVFMVALLLFSAATPTAYGQLGAPVGNLLQGTLSSIKISGSVCCSSTGNCNATTPGLSGLPVSVMCVAEAGELTVNVGQGLTGPNGTISLNLIVANIPSAIRTSLITFLRNGSVPCVAIVDLQALKLNETLCPLLTPVDTLVAPLGTITSIVSSMLGLVALVSLQSFTIMVAV